jgi:hypothetical protein
LTGAFHLGLKLEEEVAVESEAEEEVEEADGDPAGGDAEDGDEGRPEDIGGSGH